MKNLKKVLALVVALTMVFTTVAFASYPDVDATADYAGAVELLSALEVLKGDENGNFNPDNTITRAEFAAVVCRALGLEGSAASAKGATMFKDVAATHWASGYINLASQQGIVNGKGNGIFDPEGNVTFAEAVKMLVVAIGYEPMAAIKGGWPTGYLSVANSTKMTAGVAGAADAAALRSTVAMLTANAIAIPVMDQTAFGSETKYEALNKYDNYTSLLTQQDIYVATGVIGDVKVNEGTFAIDLKVASDDFAFGYDADGEENLEKYPKSFLIGESNVAEFEAQYADVYLRRISKNKYEALFAIASGAGETLTINATQLNKEKSTLTKKGEGTATLEYFETLDADKPTKIYVKELPTVYVNNVKVATAWDGEDLYDELVEKLDNARDAEITFIENDEDKYFDSINITVYEHAIVEEVDTAKERINFVNNTKVSFDFDDEDQIVNIYDVDGNEIELADVKAGDVLAMVVGDDFSGLLPKDARVFKEKITIYDLGANSVAGTLDQANEAEKYIYIDGVEYEYSEDFVSEKEFTDLFKGGEAKLGTEGTFYLGMTGKIIGFEGAEGSTGNYAFILQGDESGSTWDNCYQIKVLLADGSIKTLDIDDEVEIEGVKDPVEFAKQGTYFKLPEFSNLVKDPADVAKDTDGDGFIEGDKEGTKDDKGENKVESDVEVGYILNADAPNRVIDYKANSKGVVTYIDFVGKASNNELDDAKTYDVDSYRVGGYTLASDVVIFKVDSKDADDATVVGLDSLVDEGTYKGYVAVVDDDEYDVLVMLEGDAAFDAEAPLYVVDSKVKTTYGDDKEDAIAITYYVDGSNETATAIFTADAKNKGNIKYEDLTKGSLFVANTAADGLVGEYVVFAKVVNNEYVVDATAKYAAYGLEDGDDVEIIYDFISTIKNNKTIKFNGTYKYETYTVKPAAAQYYYNTSGNKPKLEVGDWYGLDVDEAIKNEETNKVYANKALVKAYEGKVTDVVAFSARTEVK